MKERPILFSGPMVKAILEGRKTQTRRTVKIHPGLSGRVKEPGGHRNWHLDDPNAVIACPYGRPGDRLWVRETWRTYKSLQLIKPSGIERGAAIEYQAGGSNVSGYPEPLGLGKWRPSIFMPRWASRITLEIVSVRVERLNDISEEDAIAEGINPIAHGRSGYYYSAFKNEPDPKNWCHAGSAYEELWESINGPGSWAANPWVWVVEFRRVQP